VTAPDTRQRSGDAERRAHSVAPASIFRRQTSNQF
jgi:hypothetical protein